MCIDSGSSHGLAWTFDEVILSRISLTRHHDGGSSYLLKYLGTNLYRGCIEESHTLHYLVYLDFRQFLQNSMKQKPFEKEEHLHLPRMNINGMVGKSVLYASF